jgi:hypothetical protein
MLPSAQHLQHSLWFIHRLLSSRRIHRRFVYNQMSKAVAQLE